MSIDDKAFASVPQLRGKILDPAQSRFRSIDYDEFDRIARETGLPENWRRSHEDREVTRQATMAGRLDRDLWVFAYGSLMWDPAFYFEEVRLAQAVGYRRCFCLELKSGRGTPDAPGLMAALDHGGYCDGLAFRIAADKVDGETEVIWQREMIGFGYVPSFVQLVTKDGPLEALTFVVDQRSERYKGDLAIEDAASLIAVAAGVLGTNLEYLQALASQLELLGLSDEAFDALHDLVHQQGSSAA
jgi:cation transport protein ChaC